MVPTLNPATLGGLPPGNGLPQGEAFVRLAARHGFRGVEAGVDVLEAWAAARSLEGVRAVLAETGVAWAATGLPVALCEGEASFREGLGLLARRAALAAAVGCRRMCAWLPPSVDGHPAPLAARLVRRVRACARVLADAGSRLGLEWVGPVTARTRRYPFFYDPAGLGELVEAVGEPNVGFLVDSFHWFTAGLGRGDLASLPGAGIVHVHINDAPPRPREEQLDLVRLLPGEGVIDLAAFLAELRAEGYDGPVAVETFSRELAALGAEEAARRAGAAVRAVLARAT